MANQVQRAGLHRIDALTGWHLREQLYAEHLPAIAAFISNFTPLDQNMDLCNQTYYTWNNTALKGRVTSDLLDLFEGFHFEAPSVFQEFYTADNS